MPKLWYRFSTGTFRPYVGIGVGLGHVAEPDVTIENSGTIKGAKRLGLGGNVEVGLKIKGLSLSYSYNHSGKVSKEPVFVPAAAGLAVNYHRYSLGFIHNF